MEGMKSRPYVGGGRRVRAATDPPRRTYRQPITCWGGSLGAVFFAALAVREPDIGVRSIDAVGAAILLWIAWWPRLVVSATGLTVVYVRWRHIPWRDIQSLSLTTSPWSWDGPVLTVRTQKGDVVRVWAVAFTRIGGAQYCQRTLQAVRSAQRQRHP
jgi:pimeloyl-ACP methyl ester carboxylesterase